jgi:hypothetical protein
MTDKLAIALLTILALPVLGASQHPKDDPRAQSIPSFATIEISLIGAPGINDERSYWEVAYEVRLASGAAIWDWHKRNEASGGRRG